MSGPFSKFGIPLDPVTGKTVTIQPKLGYRFRIRFLQFGGLESATYSFDAMQQVVSVSRPVINFSVKKLGTYSGTVNIINKPTFDPISITFRDDIANTLAFAIGSQLQRQYDFKNGRYAISTGSAKFTTIIETLDGENPMRAVDAFRLENCIINNVNFGQLEYSNSQPVNVTFNIEYDYLGGYYSEVYGIDDAIHMLWDVTTNPSAFATKPQTPFNGGAENPDLIDRAISGVKGLFS
jgi:hypothetical protein